MESSERHVELDEDVLTPSNFGLVNQAGSAVATNAITDLLEDPTARWPDEEFTEESVEIRTTEGERRLITSIEILSAANMTRGKTGRGQYPARQHEFCATGINMVEIDVLRGGVHATAVSKSELHRRAGQYDYHIYITCPIREGASYIQPIRLDQRLLTTPIPLTEGHSGVSIDFQAVFDRCYDDARYERWVKYNRPCDPPMIEILQEWADRYCVKRA